MALSTVSDGSIVFGADTMAVDCAKAQTVESIDEGGSHSVEKRLVCDHEHEVYFELTCRDQGVNRHNDNIGTRGSARHAHNPRA